MGSFMQWFKITDWLVEYTVGLLGIFVPSNQWRKCNDDILGT
jgi:hypothetical protein